MGSIFLILFFAGCDPLEKENLTAISANDVYSTPAIAEAYVNNIYAALMPDNEVWSFESYDTDEAMGTRGNTSISDYLRGTITSDVYDNYPYDDIRKINMFLEHIDDATFEEAIKGRLKGEMLFWRAWAYFSMVRAYGGVPLVLKAEAPDNEEAIFVPRSKTSECYVQILKDLDDAISLLPDPTGNGRIDKGAAMAFKGRVALFQASPQFNRNNMEQLWKDAYDANKSAIDYLNTKGKGLVEDFGSLWKSEMSKEVIMVRRHSYPESTNGYSQVCVWPLLYARGGCAGGNMPSLELVNAFPMKDGSKWDPNARDYAALSDNRDARFYATIAYNGAKPYLKPMFGKENLWAYWYDKDGNTSTGINGREARTDFLDLYESGSGFYTTKMIDPNLDEVTKVDGTIDWIEIRYSEVVMNLAEAANETGKTDEAIQLLGQIRARAGIEPGAGNKYGITASTQAEIRQTIMDERFVEFAFEKKRFWDLRRWRVYKSRMEGLQNSVRHGIRVEWAGPVSERPTGLEDIDSIWNKFDVTTIEDVVPINMLSEDKYSFLGIPAKYLERNSKLEQNDTWGGTFDPLE
jgi:hypothetical protein